MSLNYFICVTESSLSSLTIETPQEYVLVDTHKRLNVGTFRLNPLILFYCIKYSSVEVLTFILVLKDQVENMLPFFCFMLLAVLCNINPRQ